MSFSGGTLQQHIERQREKLPVIDEETCFVFVRDILKGLAFLNSKGLVHGDIKGSLFARIYLRLEMIIIISLQIIFCLFFLMSLPDFAGIESHARSLSPSDYRFQKFQTILSWLSSQVDMLRSNDPEIKLVWAVWRSICIQFCCFSQGNLQIRVVLVLVALRLADL